MFKNLKIGKRMLISYACVIVLAVLMAVLALTGLKKANTDLNDFIDHSFAADSAVKMCRIYVNQAAREIREMLVNKDTSSYASYRTRVETSIDSIYENVALFEKSYTEDDGLPQKYKESLDRWIAIGTDIMVQIERGNDERAAVMLVNDCAPALAELVELAREIDAKTVALQNASLTENKNETTFYSIALVLLLALAVIVSVLIGTSTTKGIVGPVREIERAAKNLSKGILETEITYTSKNELGQMADSMRSSLATLSLYIHDIDRSMETMARGDFNIAATEPFIGDFANIEKSFLEFSAKISKVLHEISQTADQVTMGSSHVADSAQELSQGATEQAGSIEQLSASVTEISGYVQNNAANARHASENAQKTAGEINASNRQMQDMKSAMNEISNKSAEIQKIIKAIEDIAFQTNILALNAAVEAARAGAAGKGFAVVADEVRNLASKSAEAAKNTTVLIEDTVRAVDHGTELADSTAQAMVAVVDSASEITRVIEEIANASNDQATSLAQVTQGVEQISGVVQTNSATAEESAAASEELSGQAEGMKMLVDRFVLRRDVLEGTRVKETPITLAPAAQSTGSASDKY